MSNTPKYLGETIINDLVGTPFENYTVVDWAIRQIDMYGGIDGACHKHDVLTDVLMILMDSDIIVSLAKWDDGQEEYRVSFKASKKFSKWLKEREKDGYPWEID